MSDELKNNVATDPTSATAPGQPAPIPTSTPPPNSVAPSGKRQAFDDVLKPLTPEELSSPGTQKLILYMLQKSQGECDVLEGYMERFHEADKRAAILQEQLDTQTRLSRATDIAVIIGTTLGGAMIGLATYFWGKTTPDVYAGVFACAIGVLLIIGAVAVKIARR